eukprot:6132794-Prorocentrum_lima.AAC.1
MCIRDRPTRSTSAPPPRPAGPPPALSSAPGPEAPVRPAEPVFRNPWKLPDDTAEAHYLSLAWGATG